MAPASVGSKKAGSGSTSLFFTPFMLFFFYIKNVNNFPDSGPLNFCKVLISHFSYEWFRSGIQIVSYPEPSSEPNLAILTYLIEGTVWDRMSSVKGGGGEVNVTDLVLDTSGEPGSTQVRGHLQNHFIGLFLEPHASSSFSSSCTEKLSLTVTRLIGWYQNTGTVCFFNTEELARYFKIARHRIRMPCFIWVLIWCTGT